MQRVLRQQVWFDWGRYLEVIEQAFKAEAERVDMKACEHLLFFADRQGPAEYCPEEAVEGSDFCEDHDPELGVPDWDDRRKDALLDCE